MKKKQKATRSYSKEDLNIIDLKILEPLNVPIMVYNSTEKIKIFLRRYDMDEKEYYNLYVKYLEGKHQGLENYLKKKGVNGKRIKEILMYFSK